MHKTEMCMAWKRNWELIDKKDSSTNFTVGNGFTLITILIDKLRIMLLNEDLTKVIIECFYKVYNQLGYGFLKKVYENAFVIELRKQGLTANQQQAINVYYDDIEVRNYFADIKI